MANKSEYWPFRKIHVLASSKKKEKNLIHLLTSGPKLSMSCAFYKKGHAILSNTFSKSIISNRSGIFSFSVYTKLSISLSHLINIKMYPVQMINNETILRLGKKVFYCSWKGVTSDMQKYCDNDAMIFPCKWIPDQDPPLCKDNFGLTLLWTLLWS